MMDYQHASTRPAAPIAAPHAPRAAPRGYHGGLELEGNSTTRMNRREGLHARAPHVAPRAQHPVHPQQTSPAFLPARSTAVTSLADRTEARRRRTKSLLLLAFAAFAGMLVLDVLTHFSDLPERTERAIKEGEASARRLIDGEEGGGGPGFLRRLAGSLLLEEAGNKSDWIAAEENTAGRQAELPSRQERLEGVPTDADYPRQEEGLKSQEARDGAAADDRLQRVAVPFLHQGTEQVYTGTVTARRNNLWYVTFDDGDTRALDGEELEDAVKLYERLNSSEGGEGGEGLPREAGAREPLPPPPSDPDLTLIGRRIASRFLVDGTEEVFLGTVAGHRGPDSALFPDTFDVRYDDGDLRVLARHELESALGLYGEHEGRDLLDRSFGSAVGGGGAAVGVGRSPGGLRTLPLLPRHALQHRQRRELIASARPVPDHLAGRHDDGGYADRRLRRRAYLHPLSGTERRMQEGKDAEYEVGALYQGYGTHYAGEFLW